MVTRRRLLALLVTALPAMVSAYDIQVPVHADSLSNGLKILVVPDTNVAVVSCRLYYFVGSMYEGPGTTGLSHMFEHMMFKGTKRLGTSDYAKEVPVMQTMDSLEAAIQSRRESGASDSDAVIRGLRDRISANLDKQRRHIKKDEIWQIYQDNGGTNLNAWTADDMTAYIVTLPKNKVELFCWIEADRMRSPVLREFDSERDVVAEERRMRYDNIPLNRYFERLNALFYTAHPYRNPTIGWMSDIQAYTRKKLQDHVARFYTPDDAIIVLVGNVDPARCVDLIRRYFGDIPRAAQRKQEVVTREPEPVGETRFTVRADAEPRIDIMYHTPGYPNDDLYALDVVEGILSGRSGRLYSRLVTKERLCTDAGASNSFRLHNGEFQVWATLKDETDPAAVERILLDEMQRLTKESPSPVEMERDKNTIRMTFVSGLKSLEGISDRLAAFERLGSWKGMLEYPEKIAQVKREAIPGVAARYFGPDTKTVGLLLKKNAHADQPAPGAKGRL